MRVIVLFIIDYSRISYRRLLRNFTGTHKPPICISSGWIACLALAARLVTISSALDSALRHRQSRVVWQTERTLHYDLGYDSRSTILWLDFIHSTSRQRIILLIVKSRHTYLQHIALSTQPSIELYRNLFIWFSRRLISLSICKILIPTLVESAKYEALAMAFDIVDILHHSWAITRYLLFL